MEGGAKGVILLSLAHQDRAPVAFRKYVDCLLDVVMPQVRPSVSRLDCNSLGSLAPAVQ